ncbi:MAG: hypothetical protein HON25_00070 [Gammaproteobacteria bacterium]|jgi:hypothetical protein|nr:hypothetical protein [Gammaproteobacteria bacterium]
MCQPKAPLAERLVAGMLVIQSGQRLSEPGVLALQSIGHLSEAGDSV